MSNSWWGQLIQMGGNDVTDDIPTKFLFNTNNGEIIFGRLEENSQVVINKPYVSAKHFMIQKVYTDSVISYKITDYSSNGTYLNGELIGKGNSKNLQHNDQVIFKFRGIEKLIFQFHTNSTGNGNGNGNENENDTAAAAAEEGPPLKSQRSEKKRNHSSILNNQNNDVDISSIKRINALEKEIQQQEIRIANQNTKLETSAREFGNLQTTYLSLRDVLNAKENELNDAKQTRLMLESSLAAMEARCHNLDDTIANMKIQMDHQRDQLRLSEERATMSNELQMKLDNLSDELSHKKVQFESLNQVYEDLNLTYQREKRSREKYEEENKKLHGILKQTDEIKQQFQTNTENLKKELQLFQDTSKQNEEKFVEMRQLLFRVRKEWMKERTVWSRISDSFLSATQLVYDRAQESKKVFKENSLTTNEFEKDLDKFLLSYSSEMISLSQRPPSIPQSLKQQQPQPHQPQPHQQSSPHVSVIPFTQIHDGLTLSDQSLKAGQNYSDGTEKSQGNLHLFGSQSEKKLKENDPRSHSHPHSHHQQQQQEQPQQQQQQHNENEENENGGDEFNEDVMCLVDEQNTLSTPFGQYNLTRHGTMCDTHPSSDLVTQLPDPLPPFTEKPTEEKRNSGSGGGSGGGEDNEQLSPTIQSSGSSRKVTSSLGSGPSSSSHVEGSTSITPSRRQSSFLSGWIDESVPMNKTQLIHHLRGGLVDSSSIEDCKRSLEYSEDINENHLYDVEEDDDDDDEEEEGGGGNGSGSGSGRGGRSSHGQGYGSRIKRGGSKGGKKINPDDSEECIESLI